MSAPTPGDPLPVARSPAPGRLRRASDPIRRARRANRRPDRSTATTPRRRARADASIPSRAAAEFPRRPADIRSSPRATHRARDGRGPRKAAHLLLQRLLARCADGTTRAAGRSRGARARAKTAATRAAPRCSANGSSSRSRTRAHDVPRGDGSEREVRRERCDVRSSAGSVAANAYCAAPSRKEAVEAAARAAPDSRPPARRRAPNSRGRRQRLVARVLGGGEAQQQRMLVRGDRQRRTTRRNTARRRDTRRRARRAAAALSSGAMAGASCTTSAPRAGLLERGLQRARSRCHSGRIVGGAPRDALRAGLARNRGQDRAPGSPRRTISLVPRSRSSRVERG